MDDTHQETTQLQPAQATTLLVPNALQNGTNATVAAVWTPDGPLDHDQIVRKVAEIEVEERRELEGMVDPEAVDMPRHLPSAVEVAISHQKIEKLRSEIQAEATEMQALADRLNADIEAAKEYAKPLMAEYYRRYKEIEAAMAQIQRAHGQKILDLVLDHKAKSMVYSRRIRTKQLKIQTERAFIAPIRRLTPEIIAEILTIVATETISTVAPYTRAHTTVTSISQSQVFRLMRVCRLWRSIILSHSKFWKIIEVTQSTKPEFIDFLVLNSGVQKLEITIDIETESGEYSDPIDIPAVNNLVTQTLPRWEKLTVKNFPNILPIPAFKDADMRTLKSFSVLTDPQNLEKPFAHLVASIAKTAILETLDLASSRVMESLSASESCLANLRSLTLDCKEWTNPVDIFPMVPRLEEFICYRINIPEMYNDDLSLPIPFCSTLKRLVIRGVNISWMSGRSFPNLVKASITWPQGMTSQEWVNFRSRGGIDAPVLTDLYYEDYVLEPLRCFKAPNLDRLEVLNDSWSKARGDAQLQPIWPAPDQNGAIIHDEYTLNPRVIKFETISHDVHFINALRYWTNCEELEIVVVRTECWGKKLFAALQAKKAKGTPWELPILPNLINLRFVYKFWYGYPSNRDLRNDVQDDITPALEKIKESREKSVKPLKSLKLKQGLGERSISEGTDTSYDIPAGPEIEFVQVAASEEEVAS